MNFIQTTSVLALLCTSASAQSYLPASAGKAENRGQNQWLGGQRSDLEFELKNVQFQTEPCKNGAEGKVLLGCTFDVEAKWKQAGGFLQVEGAGDTNGDENLSVLYQGSGRWVLKSVTRGGASVFGGANPEGEEGAGPNGGGGVRVTPPSSFETSPNPLVYSYTFEYQAEEGECKPLPLRVRGTYSHTYDGPFEWYVSESVSIGISASYPWGVSASIGGSVTFANDTIWSKEMNDPNGTDHWKKLSPPDVYAQHDPCCELGTSVEPQPLDPVTPSGSVTPDENSPVPALVFNGVFQDLDDGLTVIEILAHTGDGQPLASTLVELDAPMTSSVPVSLSIPLLAENPTGTIVVKTMSMDVSGGMTFEDFEIGTSAAFASTPEIDQSIDLSTGTRHLTATGFQPGAVVAFYCYAPQLLGDLDFDLDVDSDDHARYLTEDWDSVSDLDNLHADINGDGSVTAADEAILIGQLGTSESAPFPVPGCPTLDLGLPTFLPYVVVADSNGTASITTGIPANSVPRLYVGAVDPFNCMMAEPIYILQR